MAIPEPDGGPVADSFPTKLKAKAAEIERLAEALYAAELAETGSDAGTGGAGKAFDWIPEAYAAFASLPHPRQFDPLVEAMAAVVRVFGDPGLENGKLAPAAGGPSLEGSLAHMVDWRGKAKDSFIRFSERWKPTPGGQAMIAAALREALTAQKVLADASRKDVMRIADQTVAALEASPCDWGDVKVALSVVSAVSSVAAAVAPGASKALTIVSAGAGFGSDAIEGDKKEMPLSGPTVHDITGNMAKALAEVSKQLDSQESEIVKALDHNVDVVTGPGRSAYLAPRPDRLTDVSLRDATAAMEPS
ncbi:MAG: hypothetical protein ACRDT4_21065 [Micromonosporaceae bacterium]